MDKPKFVTPETFVAACHMGKSFDLFVDYLLFQSKRYLLETGTMMDEDDNVVVEVQLHLIGNASSYDDEESNVIRMVGAIGDWLEGKRIGDTRVVEDAVMRIIGFGLAASGFEHNYKVEDVEKFVNENDKFKTNPKKYGEMKGIKWRAARKICRKEARRMKNINPALSIPDFVDIFLEKIIKSPQEYKVSSGDYPSKSQMDRKWFRNIMDESED